MEKPAEPRVEPSAALPVAPAARHSSVALQSRLRWRVYLLLSLGVVCLAFSPIFTRWATVPGPVSALYRMVIALVVLAVPFGGEVRRGRVPHSWQVWGIACLAGLFFALDLAIWNTSLFLTSAANSTLLDNDAPLLVGLGAFFLFRERLGRSYWFGLVLALAGMGIVVGQDVLAHPGFGLGDALALLAGACYGASMLVIQRVRAHLSALTTLYISSLTGLMVLLAYCLLARLPLWGFSVRVYLALLALGLVTQVIGWLAVNYALGHLPASVVSVTLIGQPVLAAMLAVPLLAEPLSSRQIVGGLVALLGIALVNRGFLR